MVAVEVEGIAGEQVFFAGRGRDHKACAAGAVARDGDDADIAVVSFAVAVDPVRGADFAALCGLVNMDGELGAEALGDGVQNCADFVAMAEILPGDTAQFLDGVQLLKVADVVEEDIASGSGEQVGVGGETGKGAEAGCLPQIWLYLSHDIPPCWR